MVASPIRVLSVELVRPLIGRFGDLRLDQFSGLDNDICRGSAMDEGTIHILQAQ